MANLSDKARRLLDGARGGIGAAANLVRYVSVLESVASAARDMKGDKSPRLLAALRRLDGAGEGSKE